MPSSSPLALHLTWSSQSCPLALMQAQSCLLHNAAAQMQGALVLPACFMLPSHKLTATSVWCSTQAQASSSTDEEALITSPDGELVGVLRAAVENSDLTVRCSELAEAGAVSMTVSADAALVRLSTQVIPVCNDLAAVMLTSKD